MLDAERRAVCAHLPNLAALTPGTSGNLSVRRDDRFAVTPTGIPYADIETADVPVLALDGKKVAGDTDPSSETAMHRGIYRERDTGAVAHTHSPWATTLAVLGEPVPPVHYALAHAGGTVPVAEYATYGTADLAASVVATLADADVSACLVANHGVVATGVDAAAAVEAARAVGTTARLYCQAAAIGYPQGLPESELAAVETKFDAYGQDE